jgi:hypothetical protein
MTRFFPSERIGRPQFLAGFLLLVFLGECLWLIRHEPAALAGGTVFERIPTDIVDGGAANGRDGGHRASGELDPEHSPLFYWLASVPAAVLGLSPASPLWLPATRAPYLLVGLLLGASLWYVSRRLYGNAGGYTALALYCSSPALIRAAALWLAPRNLPAVWGSFGAVFTAMALSHTLYAPREVILWNWRRILLLAVAIALSIGCQFSLVVVVPVLLVFMLYLAPERKGAALAILATSLAMAGVLLWAAYSFRAGLFWAGLKQAQWVEASGLSLRMPGAYLALVRELAESGPVVVLLAVVSLVVYVVWPRSRYFGNTAPLLVSLLFLALRLVTPHTPDAVWSLAAVVFLLVFIAGIAADVLETGSRGPIQALIVGLVAANWAWNLVALAGISRF